MKIRSTDFRNIQSKFHENLRDFRNIQSKFHWNPLYRF